MRNTDTDTDTNSSTILILIPSARLYYICSSSSIYVWLRVGDFV